MTGWIRRSTVVILATLGVSAAGSSIAQAACPHLDATCQVGQAVGDAARLVDDAIDPVVDTPVDTPVDDVVDPVVDTADPVVDDVRSVVEDILGGGHVDLPDPIGGVDGGSHVGRVPRADDDPRDTSSPGDGRRGVAGGNHHGRGLPGFAGPPIQTPSGAIADRPVDRTSGGDFGAALEGVARSLAIVVALFGLAVAFVAIQDRLDRSDPRLSIAPVDSDVMEFA